MRHDRRMMSWLPYSIVILPALAFGAIITSMSVAIPRREVNIRRVERAMLAFWVCMAILISTHYGHTLA